MQCHQFHSCNLQMEHASGLIATGVPVTQLASCHVYCVFCYRKTNVLLMDYH